MSLETLVIMWVGVICVITMSIGLCLWGIKGRLDGMGIFFLLFCEVNGIAGVLLGLCMGRTFGLY